MPNQRVEAEDHYTKLRIAFNEAELAIKQSEYLTEAALIPAINQLRYAGFHMTMSLVAGYDHAQIEKAINHCKRALYDAIEAQIVVYLGTVRIFQSDFKDVVISDVLPNYLEILGGVREARDFLEKHSLNGADVHLAADDASFDGWQHPGNVVEEAKRHLQTLRVSRTKLEDSRPELNKKIEGQRKSEFYQKTAVIFGILSILLTLFFGLCPMLN